MGEYTKSLLGVAKTIYQWLGYLAELDPGRRKRVATYAEAIADTLLRAAEAQNRFESKTKDRNARSQVRRELGRIRGYVETIVDVLEHQLDGRKLAGVKRRLERIAACPLRHGSMRGRDDDLVDRLAEAEGYFRALADGLRA